MASNPCTCPPMWPTRHLERHHQNCAAYPYRKSRLPGPAVRCFDMEFGDQPNAPAMDDDDTARVSFDAPTVGARRHLAHPALIVGRRPPRRP